MQFYLGATRVRVSFWFIAVLALFSLLDRSFIALRLIAAIALHEGMHLAWMRRARVPVRALELLPWGVRLDCDVSLLPPRGQAGVYLCAPLLNVAVGVALFVWDPMEIFGVFNLCLGVFNLLPVPPLDGGNALRALAGGRLSPTSRRLIAAAALLPVLAGAAALALHTHNVTLLVCGAYLLACAWKQE